jgi:hypothetical protein
MRKLSRCRGWGSRVGITAIGGVEAVVKVMRTFPKCHDLQKCATIALCNLVHNNSIGKNKAVESGGLEVLLAAVNNDLDNNNLDSAFFCQKACWALKIIVFGTRKTPRN